MSEIDKKKVDDITEFKTFIKLCVTRSILLSAALKQLLGREVDNERGKLNTL